MSPFGHVCWLTSLKWTWELNLWSGWERVDWWCLDDSCVEALGCLRMWSLSSWFVGWKPISFPAFFGLSWISICWIVKSFFPGYVTLTMSSYLCRFIESLRIDQAHNGFKWTLAKSQYQNPIKLQVGAPSVEGGALKLHNTILGRQGWQKIYPQKSSEKINKLIKYFVEVNRNRRQKPKQNV